MILKYTNTLDDFIELECFVNTVKKSRKFLINFYKFTIYMCYPSIIVLMFYTFFEMYKYSYSTDFVYTGAVCIVLYILFFLFLIRINKTYHTSYLNQLKKSYLRVIKKKPNLIKEKEVVLKSNKLIVNVNDSQTEILFDSIYKIFENNNKIYILNEKYKLLLLIPCKAFKNNNEKLDFLNKINSLS